MLFRSRQIKGIGRGHKVGFPTINLDLSSELHIVPGIYAAWVMIGDKTYKGALHFGSIPTFDQKEETLEVHLLDVTDLDAPDTKDKEIEIDIVEKLREVRRFDTPEELAVQIEKDVEAVRSILK